MAQLVIVFIGVAILIFIIAWLFVQLGKRKDGPTKTVMDFDFFEIFKLHFEHENKAPDPTKDTNDCGK